MIKKIIESKVSYILLSIVLSILLWLYVDMETGQVISQTFSKIPVTFEGEEALASQGLVIAHNSAEETVTLRLSGKRSVITKLENNITITVRCSQITDSGEQKLDYTIDYGNVSSSSVTVDARSKDGILVNVTKLLTKTIPVQAQFEGNIATGYYSDTDAIVCSPAELSISGPEEVVSQVSYAQVQVYGTNLTETIAGDFTYIYMDEDGMPVETDEITCSNDTVTVSMPVGKMKEVPLSVTFIDGGGATLKDNVTFSIEPETLIVAGDSATLDSLTSINLGTINLANIVTMDNISFDIVLPDNLMNISGQSKATVNVSVSGLATRIVTVNSINLINPDNYDVELVTTALTVQIRGPQESLDQVLDSYVTATVDLTDVALSRGTITVPVTVNVAGVGDVGAVGQYKAVVTVS